MAKADAIFVQRFGDNHVLYAGRIEIPFLGQIGDATIATRFFIRSAGNLYCAMKIGMFLDECFGGDNRCGQPTFHVTGAAPIDFVVVNFPTKGVFGPAGANLHHVMM